MSANPFEKLAEIKSRLPRDASKRPAGPKTAKGKPGAGGKNARGPAPPDPEPALSVASVGASGKAPEAQAPEPSEEDIFLSVMDREGVMPLQENEKLHIPVPPSPDSFKLPDLPDEDALTVQKLVELVNGEGEFDISYTDEFLEGHVKSLPPTRLRQLREGRYPIGAHLDLHGYTLAEAQAELNTQLPRFSAMGHKVVLIIHGRGRRSPNGIPVLKLNIGNILLRTSIRRYILAFVTALPYDGGAGACYVLLRRHPKISGKH
ncbi:MAG: Smr/MutS family protein [Deltaproteobacteria bacterium]|jgi:DNA-nicking Smr family endonuclease|nr:Smr/MutS family protein [Deltaproteobacteria bacterium]